MLALGPRLVYESLVHELESHDDIDAILSDATDGPELLLDVKHNQADCLIVSSDDIADIPGIYSHLFSEYPDLVVVVLWDDDGAVLLKQEVVMQEIRPVSVDALVTALRGANTYWSRKPG